MTPERLKYWRERAEDAKRADDRQREIRPDATFLSPVLIGGDEMLELLAYVDELRRDAEEMSRKLVGTPDPYCLACDYGIHGHAEHAPDCVAMKYAKKDDAP